MHPDDIKSCMKERILKELAKIAFAELSDFTDADSGEITLKSIVENENSAAIREINITGSKIRIKLHSKKRALRLLTKYLDF